MAASISCSAHAQRKGNLRKCSCKQRQRLHCACAQCTSGSSPIGLRDGFKGAGFSGVPANHNARGAFPAASPQHGSRHGAAPALARPVPAARALLRPILPALSAPRCSVPENPPEQSPGLRDCGGIGAGEAAPAAQGLGVPLWEGAQPPLAAPGAPGPGGGRGLRLGQEIPLQCLGGVSVPAAAEPRPPVPGAALWGPHRDRAGSGRRFWGVFGIFGFSSDPAELGHRPAGAEPAHRHPQQGAADRGQRPPGSHGAALGGLHRAPLWGGPGSNLHLPDGHRGPAPGLDLRGLGRLQRDPAGAAAAAGGQPGPPPQKGLTPKSQNSPQKNSKKNPKSPPKKKPQKTPENHLGIGIFGFFLHICTAKNPQKF